MWFKNLQIYRLPGFLMTADQLAAALAPQQFVEPTSSELLRQGWDAPRPAGGLVHAANGQFLLRLKTQKKLLPASVITQVAKARAAEMEKAQGFAPGKKAMKELKERVADELLPRAFAIESNTWTWIDPVNGWLVVDAVSASKADEVVKLLLKSVDKLPLENLRVQRSPVGVMTEWLQADDAPAGFTVDQDATLSATGESKATVQYKRHTLEVDELRRHIAAGKQCTKLAMTWDSKISFELDESLGIKKIKALDVLTEKEVSSKNDDERFDSDMALMTGELARMLADVVEALGGEADGDGLARPAQGDEPVRQVVGRLNKLLVADGATATLTGPGVSVTFGGAARGDEPVREQRPVSDQGLGDVPAGDGSASDPLYGQAVKLVVSRQRVSTSLVQRELRIEYSRASRLLDAMESAGVVSAGASNERRQVLASPGATA